MNTATRSRPFLAVAVTSLLGSIVLVVVELVLTMLIYSWLNSYSLNLFGTLVRLAGSVLALMTALVERFIPGMANTAYATLFGELGPKAILLLLIGLAVAALLRWVFALGRAAAGR